MSVTLSGKRYIFVCAGCGLLSDSTRRHAATCSPKCRVRAHRNGILRRRADSMRDMNIRSTTFGHHLAAKILVPDLFEKLMNGERGEDGWVLTTDDIQPEMCVAFDRLVWDAACNDSDETLQEDAACLQLGQIEEAEE